MFGQISVTASFKQKNKLEWPIEKCIKTFSCRNYRPRSISNAGCCLSNSVSFYSDTTCAVKAVTPGIVASIFEINGRCTIIIKSGKHFIWYTNLSELNFKKGNTIKFGDYLGNILKDDEEYFVEVGISTEKGELDAFDYFQNMPSSKKENESP